MATAEVLSIPKVRAHGAIRVSLPAKVAYNPDMLKKSIAKLVENLGCPHCFSGADCLFQFERNFVVDPQGAFTAVAAELNPQPLPPRESSVTVSLARGARYDIEKVYKAVDGAIRIIGACPCHSGFDVLYQNEIEFIGINERGEAQ